MKVKVCTNCRNEYRDKHHSMPQFLRSKFCSLKCKGIWQSVNKKGSANPNFRGGPNSCSDCGEKLAARYTIRITRYCRKCWAKHYSGENSPNFTGKYKMSKGKSVTQCVNCSSLTGDRQSILCKKCYRGALHPHWKGGISHLNNLIRNMPENRQWIKQCMYRDRYLCQECGGKGSGLQVHHIKSFALIIKEKRIKSVEEARNCTELWDTDNGQTLCKECHKLTENFNRKLQ